MTGTTCRARCIPGDVCARLAPGGYVICDRDRVPLLGDVSDALCEPLDVNMILPLFCKERNPRPAGSAESRRRAR